MHLATHYAPGSFLRPCLIVDTVFNSKTKETALKFVDALNTDHASELVYRRDPNNPNRVRTPRMRESRWIVIKKHKTREQAETYHLDLTAKFCNGGSQKEWDQGWDDYNALYDKWCPDEMRGETI